MKNYPVIAQSPSSIAIALFLALSWLLAAGASAQVNPCPNLGVTTTDEVCIVIGTDTAAGIFIDRDTAPLVVSMPIGDYDVNLVADYVSTPLGMAVTLEGNVQRIAYSNPKAHLTVDVEGHRLQGLRVLGAAVDAVGGDHHGHREQLVLGG